LSPTATIDKGDKGDQGAGASWRCGGMWDIGEIREIRETRKLELHIYIPPIIAYRIAYSIA
jgi:hypothetical protein